MIAKRELQQLRSEWSLDLGVIEKDYVLGWLLTGIAQHPALFQTWIFKGGTCLRKCYYETFRFSEDLDFTIVGGGPEEPEQLTRIFREIAAWLQEESGIEILVDERDALINDAGLSPEKARQVTGSDAYGPLIAALRDAQARGLDVDEALPRLISARPIDDAEDLAAVLHARVDTWVQRFATRRQHVGNLIAGLIPRATNLQDQDLARALHERERTIEQGATALLERAIEQRDDWVRRLGRPPDDERLRAAWLREARVNAAYRDLWNVHTPEPIDARGNAQRTEQASHQKRAATAAIRALELSHQGSARQQTPAPALHLDPSRDQIRGLER